MIRYAWVPVLLVLVGGWYHSTVKAAEQRGRDLAALAGLDSQRVTLQRETAAYRRSEALDARLRDSLRHELTVMGAKALLLDSAAHRGAQKADSVLLSLQNSLPQLVGVRATLDTLGMALGAERVARQAAEALAQRYATQLRQANILLGRQDSLSTLQHGAITRLVDHPVKRGFPVSVGCAAGATVSSAGFAPLGVTCGLAVRF